MFELRFFNSYENLVFPMAVNFLLSLFFPNGNFPPLKSSTIYIDRVPTAATPRYVKNDQFEHIIVTSAESSPSNFIYQLAHELGHLAARADLRHPRHDGNMWIEEAICGAYSLFAFQHLVTASGPFTLGAIEYNRWLRTEYVAEGVNDDWFEAHLHAIHGARELTDEAKKISAYIFERVPLQHVLWANTMLMGTPINPNRFQFVADWKARCAGFEALPTLIEDLLGQRCD